MVKVECHRIGSRLDAAGSRRTELGPDRISYPDGSIMAADNPRIQRIAELNRSISNRSLIWFGIRGADAAPLLALDAFGASFSVTSPVGSASLSSSNDVTLEKLSGTRVDLDLYDLDLDADAAADTFRRELLRAVSTKCVLVTYRPSKFTSALAFSMQDTLTLAGMYKDRQSAFEHKPWVETQLKRRGIRTLGWNYVADGRRSVAVRALKDGPLVLRTSRNSGGVGMALVRTQEELVEHWSDRDDQFVAIAPYIEGAIPINLSGCVFGDGSISTHPPSVQLIGIQSMTARRFGYCGNDFGLIGDFDRQTLDNLHGLLVSVGNWLHSENYVGAFGVDALVLGRDVFFTEVNARMQGSTSISSHIAKGLDLPDLLLDHVAASLGLELGYQSPTVREWCAIQPACAHLVVHNTLDAEVTKVSTDSGLAGGERWTLDPEDAIVAPGGVLGRLVWPDRVTENGLSITPSVQAAISRRHTCFSDTTQQGAL